MTGQLLALLAAYYACDVGASSGVMAAADAAECSAIYQNAKMSFLDETELATLDAAGPGPASRTAFRRFRAWEAANPDLVAELRAAAATSYVH